MTPLLKKCMDSGRSGAGGSSFPPCHRKRNSRTIQFFLIAVIADTVLILGELSHGLSPLQDLALHPWLYGYTFLGTIVAFSFFGAIIGCKEDQLEALALKDSLTGLFNSRYLWARMDEQWATGKREKSVSSLILFDLDFFKNVNDTYGHPVGDQLLQHVGQILQHAARRGDTVARIGGEEFIYFLPNTSATDATVIAERIRETISLASLTTEKKERITITVSAGVASTQDHTSNSPRNLYSLADKALYLAKKQGRNRIIISNKSSRQCEPHSF